MGFFDPAGTRSSPHLAFLCVNMYLTPSPPFSVDDSFNKRRLRIKNQGELDADPRPVCLRPKVGVSSTDVMREKRTGNCIEIIYQ